MTYTIVQEFKHNGCCIRKLTFEIRHREYIVFEQHLKEDILDPKKNTWESKYIQTFPNRHLARIFFMGKMVEIAHEEANSDELNAVVLNYAKARESL